MFKAQPGQYPINTAGTVPSTLAIFYLSAETDKGMILPKVALVSTIVAGTGCIAGYRLNGLEIATAGVAPNDVTPGFIIIVELQPHPYG